MRVTLEALFDAFAAAYAAGGRPDVVEFLDRAGTDRDELGLLIDRFLMAVPARQSTEEDLVLMEAQLSGEPPLLLLRQRRKLARTAIVDAIVNAFGIAEPKRSKVADYYHELETGLLDPGGVSSKILAVVGKVLGADVAALARLWPAPAGLAFQRKAGEPVESGLPLRSAEQSRTEGLEQDEVDRLFTAGS